MSIPLHPKYGLNVSMTTCFYCGKEKDIILPGAKVAKFKKVGLADSDGKMHSSVGCIDREPCDNCKKIMKHGIIFISTKDDDKNYRTGSWCAITENAVRKMGIQPKEVLDNILKQRVCFIQDSIYDQLGFPRNQNINNLK